MRLTPYLRALPFAFASLAPAALPLSLHAAGAPYTVIDHWKVGGEGGWDYLQADPTMHVAYLTHGTRVEVVDTNTGKSVGAITDLKGTHGVALDAAGRYGFISDGRANEVVVFDRKTYAKVQSIAAGTNPDGIVFEPFTRTVWAFNGRTMDVTVIDTAQMKVTATIKLSGKPEFPVVDGKGLVWVNVEDKNTVIKLDAKALKQLAEYPLPGCESPSGQAIDVARRRLFAVCDGKKMAVTDADSGKQVALVEIGSSPDAAGFDDKNKLAFSSNGDGTLTIVDAANDSYKVQQTLPTAKGARTMSFDPSNGRVYLLSAEYGDTPAPTAAVPRPRPTIVPGSFTVLVVSQK